MWFEELMGFREESPEQVRSQLELRGRRIRSKVNGVEVGCGRLDCPSLSELRALDRDPSRSRPSTVSECVGDVAALHRDAANADALFQVASQFNLLEMTGPDVTPERGIGIYENDRTQGPACAIACGGGTIYRNYFVPVGEQRGQSASLQIDCLADLGRELGAGLWDMRNGYALCAESGLEQIGERLANATDAERDELRSLLRIGVQHEVQVLGTGHAVTQVYCSALPVSYGGHVKSAWEPFARLVLEAAYEATLRIARIWKCGPVYLTRLGGGAFGNCDDWIDDSILYALRVARGLDIRIVSYDRPSRRVASILSQVETGAGPGPGKTSRDAPIHVALVNAPDGPRSA